MTGRLRGRVALVTGAGGGIGAAVARSYAVEGATVVVAEIDQGSGRSVADGIGGLFALVDVFERRQVEEAVHRTVQELRCPSQQRLRRREPRPGGAQDRRDARRGVETGFYGPFWAMRAAFPHMKARGWGRRVVKTCSLNGVNAQMDTPEYNVATEALRMLTRTDADIAPVAVFLASDECRYLTGCTLFVDGGAHIEGVAWTPSVDPQ